jgi:hypothetical protein
MPTTIPTTTSTTRPGSPSTGDAYFETDTNKYIIYDGANWRVWENDGVNFGANTKSFEPDGTDDLLTVSNSSGVFTFGDGTNDSPFSMSTWVRTASSPTSGDGTRFITQANPSGTGISILFAVNNGNGKFELQVRDSSGNWIGIDSTVASGNTWYHVGCTYDGSKSHTGIKLYLNGSLETSTSNISSGSYSAYNNGGYQLVIGGLLYNSTINRYNPSGTLQDDVAIFNAVLSASEMNGVYNGNYNPNKLISLYRAEDNTNDSFGSNNASAPNGMGYSTTLHP